MKLMPMPREASWWLWLATAVLLGTGLAGHGAGFAAAAALSAAQCAGFYLREKSFAFPVQVRVAFTALLLVCLLPGMRWLFWVPMLGTTALVLFGYCLMARLLSLLPWHRSEPLSIALVRRTLLRPPLRGDERQGLPGCRCRL